MPWDEPRVRRPRRKRRVARRQPGYSGGRSAVCQRLERRLVQESSRGANRQSALPQINSQIRRYKRQYKRASAKLNRAQCYDTFLFIKTLRQSRKCRRLERNADDAKKRMRQLEAKRSEVKGGRRNNSYQDEIIASLARNNCGANYQREARRRENVNNPFSSAFWQDEEDTGPAPRLRYGALPFATYKTVCVRLCDGYYFPVSFSTLPNHFKRDINVCQSKCAAPADLYYYQNPGEAVEQMVSATRQTPYTKLPMAWRYRKEYVRGCSCKQAEYDPQADDPNRKAEADTSIGVNDGGFKTSVQQDPVPQ